MNRDFKQTCYPLDLQCGRAAWNETRLTVQFAKQPRPQRTYFRHLLADHLNRSGSTPFTAAEMELWATMNQVLRYVAEDFLVQRGFVEQNGAVKVGSQNFDLKGLEPSFELFVDAFPVPPVELKETASKELILTLRQDKQLKELLLEMILLYIQNRNPALDVARKLFSSEEQQLQKLCRYRQQLEAFDRALPDDGDIFSDRPQTLLARLLEPIEQGSSLQEQLQILQQTWVDILPENLLERISSAFVQLEREGFQPDFSGEPETTALDPAAMQDEEYADFTVDVDWMPRTVLLAKSTYVWLEQLSRRYHRTINRLDQIPDEELDQLATSGFTSLWLIGIWHRSQASLKVKNLCGQVQVAASAYAIDDYRIAADLGGDEAFDNLHGRCQQRGINLACDVVTNHTGIESALLRDHPDWFVQLSHPPYPGYQFSGPDLSDDPSYAVQIEDGYYDHSEAAVVCRYQHRQSGEIRYIYHGNDGTHLPWNDTAQLNYLLPQVREAMIRLIIDVARRFRIIRFDAAMTLAKRHFQRLWYPLPGGGEGVPSRSDYAMSREDFERVFPVEFWRELVDRIRLEAPDTLLVAEAFWLMEGYFVRTLGMHRVYNSAFMNMLKREENAKYRETLKNILAFDPAILQRFVNFMSNPDEKPAIEQFGDGDKYFCAATMLATMPGLPMFGHGQIEGLNEKYGMEYLAPRWDEQPNEALIDRHKRQIFPLLRQRALFSGAEHFQLYDFVSTYGVEEDVFAYSNGLGDQTTLAICNNSEKSISGQVGQAVSMADKEGVDLVSACGIDRSSDFILMKDLGCGLHYLHPAESLASGGDFQLLPYDSRVLGQFLPLEDSDGRWCELWQRYGDSGRRNIYLDRDAMLLESSWDAIKQLLTIERPDRAQVKIAAQLEPLIALYQNPNLSLLPPEYLLELLIHALFPSTQLKNGHFDELAALLTSHSVVEDDQLFLFLDRFFNHRQFRSLLDCHYYDHIDWFSKERFETFFLLLLQFELFLAGRDSSSDSCTLQGRVILILKALNKVKQQAEKQEYRVDSLLKELEPGRMSEKVISVKANQGKNILFVASEAAPFAKTGGLADVVGSLPRALRELGHDVRVIIPCHRSAMLGSITPLKTDKSIEIGMNGTAYRGSLKEAVYDGVPYWFVDTPEFFDRSELYGTARGDYPDNALRFGFFARAVLELTRVAEFKPDLIHLHDWQAGLIPALLKTSYAEQSFYADIKTLLTVHNLGYQGMFPTDQLDQLDLPQELSSPEMLEYYGRLSFLKGGITLSDFITTVSPTYCNEIQEPEQGQGFDGLLRSRRNKLHGIINGLDLRVWNPADDPFLKASYTTENIRGKNACKKALQQELGLEVDSSKPIVTVVSRLDPQKGIDLIESIWPRLMERDLQFVLLGSGNQDQMRFWQEQQGRNPDRVSINLTFNEGLSHRLYAASDLLLVPSRYEPCGLTQMIALKYGALPVVRKTGGLADSIIDVDAQLKEGYGFVFDDLDPEQLLTAVDRGLSLYSQRRRWLAVVKRGMGIDFSWSNSARQYRDLYRNLMEQD